MHLNLQFIIKIHFNEEKKVDIKLETPEYHLVLFSGDFFTIDFLM